MTIRLSDDLVKIGDVPSQLLGRPVNNSTIWRWCTHGANGVILDSVLVGSHRYTTRGAFDKFVAESTARREKMLAEFAAVRAARPKPKRLTAAEKRMITGEPAPTRGRPRKYPSTDGGVGDASRSCIFRRESGSGAADIATVWPTGPRRQRTSLSDSWTDSEPEWTV